MKASPWALAIHGGAGTIERATMTPHREAEFRAALSSALENGARLLTSGDTALNAVESTIRVLEDDPLFNAGRGAAFTAAGRNELDASIMDGAMLRAGAVAGVTRVRHPISLARAVMEKSPHVMLSGTGAEEFAEEQGIELVEPSFFFTESRWKELEKALAKGPSERHFGTVGVVALDNSGNVAAGTSTGGTTGKKWGRIGDSPIIGAGTYASNQSCAVSCTGAGEFFIRLTLAREICALVEYKGYSIQMAADELIHKRLAGLGGSGGAIAVSPQGDIAWSFNTLGMFRAKCRADSSPTIALFSDEP